MLSLDIRFAWMLVGFLCMPLPLVATTFDYATTLGPTYNDHFTVIRDGIGGPVTVVLDGGSPGDITVFGSSTLVIDSGFYVDLDSYDTSTVRINGGETLGDGVVARGESSITIFSGKFKERLWATDGATLNIHGGTYSLGVGALEEGTLNIFGRNLVSTLVKDSSGTEMTTHYAVSGLLADGTTVSDLTVDIGPTSQFVLHNVPEPSFGMAWVSILCLLLDFGRRRIGRDKKAIM